jgi:hypothetical protein
VSPNADTVRQFKDFFRGSLARFEAHPEAALVKNGVDREADGGGHLESSAGVCAERS